MRYVPRWDYSTGSFAWLNIVGIAQFSILALILLNMQAAYASRVKQLKCSVKVAGDSFELITGVR